MSAPKVTKADILVELEKTGVMFGAGPFFADNESDWTGQGW